MVNHTSVCQGDLVCPRCGRRMCQNCVTTFKFDTLPFNEGHEGECLICSGMYEDDEIGLFPIPGVQEQVKVFSIKKRMLRFR